MADKKTFRSRQEHFQSYDRFTWSLIKVSYILGWKMSLFNCCLFHFAYSSVGSLILVIDDAFPKMCRIVSD